MLGGRGRRPREVSRLARGGPLRAERRWRRPTTRRWRVRRRRWRARRKDGSDVDIAGEDALAGGVVLADDREFVVGDAVVGELEALLVFVLGHGAAVLRGVDAVALAHEVAAEDGGAGEV